MKTAARPERPLQDETSYLRAEMAEIRDIYTRLLPDRKLRIVYYQGEDLHWGAPSLLDHEVTFTPAHLTPEYLGTQELPAPGPGARPATLFVSIPRRPTPAQLQPSEGDWLPQSRKLQMLFSAFPRRYEWLRYRAEMQRKAASRSKHNWKSLPRSAGAAMLRPRGPEAARIRPPALAAPLDPAGPLPAGAPRPAILIGVHWLEVGGAEKLAFDCMAWALAAGLRVFVVSANSGPQSLAHRLPDHPDLRFIRLDRYLPHVDWPRYIAHLAQAENIRALHIHHCVPLYDSLAHLAVVAPWLKVIDSTHIIEYADGGYPRISAVWSNFIDIHHVISRELVDFFRREAHLVDRVRLGRMLERGADTAPPPPAPRMCAGKPVLEVAFVGRLFYQKRPIVVVETLRALAIWAARNKVELRATLVGEGPFGKVMRALIARYRLGAMVRLMPAGSDVPALLAQADLLLVPSNNEGLALVCYEAIEAGCIPLSTDVGSQSELIPEALRLPLEPGATVRATVALVDRLWREPGFAQSQGQALAAAYARLSADPTAREVLMPIYHAIATGEES